MFTLHLKGRTHQVVKYPAYNLKRDNQNNNISNKYLRVIFTVWKPDKPI